MTTNAIFPRDDRMPPSLTARTLIAIAGLNLNGLAFMLFGVGQAFSPILLGGSLYLAAACGRNAARDPLVIALALFTFLYVTVGMLVSGGAAPSLSYALTYASSFLILFAVAAYVSSLQSWREIEELLTYAKHVLLLSCVAVLASGKLAFLYTHQLSSEDRNGGFFGNANEAGIVGAVTLALVLAAPSSRRWLNVVHAAIAITAVFLTFSKSGLLVSLIVIAVLALRRPTVSGLIGAAVILIGSWFALELVSGQDALRITGSQKERLSQILEILAGGISDRTTTGRTELWSIAVDHIERSFPFGEGLGQLNHMVGGIMNEGVWMGAHNTYLMVWGEAGLPALVALLVAMSLLLARIWRRGSHAFLLLYFIILQFDMMAAHNVLALRFHNVLLGLVIGITIWQANQVKAVGSTP